MYNNLPADERSERNEALALLYLRMGRLRICVLVLLLQIDAFLEGAVISQSAHLKPDVLVEAAVTAEIRLNSACLWEIMLRLVGGCDEGNLL